MGFNSGFKGLRCSTLYRINERNTFELQSPAMGRQLGAWHLNFTYSKTELYKEVAEHAYIPNIFTVFLLIDLLNDSFSFL